MPSLYPKHIDNFPYTDSATDALLALETVVGTTGASDSNSVIGRHNGLSGGPTGPTGPNGGPTGPTGAQGLQGNQGVTAHGNFPTACAGAFNHA